MNLKQLTQAVEAVGGTIAVEESGRVTVLNVDAPAGHCWGPGLHCLTATWCGTVKRPTWAEEKRDAIEDMAGRVCPPEPCDCEDCRDSKKSAVHSIADGV